MEKKSTSLTNEQFEQLGTRITLLRVAINDGRIVLDRLISKLVEDEEHYAVDEPTATEVTVEAQDQVDFTELCLKALNDATKKLRADFGCNVMLVVEKGHIKMSIYEKKILSG